MKNCLFNKTTLLVCALVFSATVAVRAADLAEASGTVAGVALTVVEANSQLAEAAGGGDLGAIAEAQKRARAVDVAMGDAVEAYAALEGGDDSASEELDEALKRATDALNGIYYESKKSKQSKHAKWKKDQENAGGGPGRAYDPPNLYDVPWETAGLRSFYQGLFGNLWGGSSFGGGRDRDATPE